MPVPCPDACVFPVDPALKSVITTTPGSTARNTARRSRAEAVPVGAGPCAPALPGAWPATAGALAAVAAAPPEASRPDVPPANTPLSASTATATAVPAIPPAV